MSLIELIFARKEVLLSLAPVAFFLFMAIVLTVGPMIRRKWKRAMTKRRIQRAARIARLKEQRRLQKAMQDGMMAGDLEDDGLAVGMAEEVPAEEIPAEETEEQEEEAPMDEPLSDLQAMFEGVFDEDEVNQRYKHLLGGMEPVDIDALAKLTEDVHQELSARGGQREDR